MLAERAVTDYGTTPHDHGSRRTVTVKLSESPLETLRGDYEAAALGPHIAMSWENIPLSQQKRGVSAGLNRTERMMNAKSRFDAALEALGPDLSRPVR